MRNYFEMKSQLGELIIPFSKVVSASRCGSALDKKEVIKVDVGDDSLSFYEISDLEQLNDFKGWLDAKGHHG